MKFLFRRVLIRRFPQPTLAELRPKFLQEAAVGDRHGDLLMSQTIALVAIAYMNRSHGAVQAFEFFDIYRATKKSFCLGELLFFLPQISFFWANQESACNRIPRKRFLHRTAPHADSARIRLKRERERPKINVELRTHSS